MSESTIIKPSLIKDGVLMNVYKVTFIEYENYDQTIVRKDNISLNLGHEPFLVLEKDLELYRQYGGGYRSIELVGKMHVIPED